MSLFDGLRVLTRVVGSIRPGRRTLPAAATSAERVPRPPWSLRGSGLLAIELVSLDAARRAIGDAADDFELVAVAPLVTMAMTFFCRYDESPVGPYHEGMRVGALVRPRTGGAPGFLVTWIPVDNERSVEGGRANWGVPKVQADFTWSGSGDPRGTVSESGRTLAIAASSSAVAVPVTLVVPFLARRGDALVCYETTFAASVAPAHILVEASAEHPGAMLGQSVSSIHLKSFDLLVGAPTAL